MRRGPSAQRMRRLLLAAVVGLFAASIPWYRGAGEESALWLGLPDWVTVALGCYVAAAVLNAAAWLLTDVPDRVGTDEKERR